MSFPAPASQPGRHLVLVLGATLVAVVLSFLAITPKLVPWRDNGLVYETTKVEPMTAQLADPVGWEKQYRDNPEFNGIQTIRWRMLPPVLGHALGLDPHVYFTLPWAGVILLVGLAIHYALARGTTPAGALAIGVLAGTSSACFSATCAVGYFDPFYLIPLLVACYTPSTVLLAAACFVGPWVDEKFLFMLPACCAVRWTWRPDRRWFLATAAIAPYCLLRLAALIQGDSSLSRQVDMQGAVFWNYAPALPEGWWYGFRVGWVLFFAGLWQVWRTQPPVVRGWLLTSLVVAVGPVSFLAWDTTRSIAMLLPLLLLGSPAPVTSRWLPWLALANLLLPAAYVWCGQPVTVPLTSILWR